jgi:chaperonin GroEL (HSP60 family)
VGCSASTAFHPTKVERVALQDAASIASLLPTTEVLITERRSFS